MASLCNLRFADFLSLSKASWAWICTDSGSVLFSCISVPLAPPFHSTAHFPLSFPSCPPPSVPGVSTDSHLVPPPPPSLSSPPPPCSSPSFTPPFSSWTGRRRQPCLVLDEWEPRRYECMNRKEDVVGRVYLWLWDCCACILEIIVALTGLRREHLACVRVCVCMR